mmetsp:Transcript_23840/g.35445  ORF Transcript_23840/g.35445 Transcript_23840/m.35445 type:complete len:470 (-) Transcript_23840:416-1825(-)
MGKKKGHSKGTRSTENWGCEKHEARISRKVAKLNKEDDVALKVEGTKNEKKRKGFERSMHLSHDNYEKKQEAKLKLHISKTRRELEKLRDRLSAWDEVEEQVSLEKHLREVEEARMRLENETSTSTKKKRKKRSNPEAWTLKGAARPAWEVYDFDTRYVDPYLKAHEEAREKAKRVINAFQYCKGMFGDVMDDNNGGEGKKKVSDLLAQTCRSYLSLSMQSALLNLEARKFARARELFLEIIELEGISTLNPITNARCRLMRMYIEANRTASARRLWERLPPDYSSVWIRYSAALLEFVSWKILDEDGSSMESARKMLAYAIRSNVFCAYYIAFHETFEKVMEYTDDVEDAQDGTLEQAIEYCNSEQMGNWIGTEGAVDFLKSAIIEVINSAPEKNMHHFNTSDLRWEEKIASMEMEYDNEIPQKEEGDEYQVDAEDAVEPDVLMFAGMFRVGMDMISDTGRLMRVQTK